jgi:O-antigen ligase
MSGGASLESAVPAPEWMRRARDGAALLFLASMYFSIAVSSISLGLMAAALLVIMVKTRRWSLAGTPLDYFFLAYVAVEMISTVFSVNPAQSLLFSRRLLLIGIVYFFASTVTERKCLGRSVGVLLGAVTIAAVAGCGFMVFHGSDQPFRLGLFTFYMTASGQMMVAALMLLPFIVHRSSPARVRWLAALAMAPVLVCLYGTVTRGAYLAFLVGALVVVIIRNKWLLIPLALLLLLIVFFSPPYIESRIQSVVDPNHPENVTRISMWVAGIRIFADHPWVGVGDIDLGDLMREHADPGYLGLWGHLHNVPLQVLVTLGVLGFVVVLALFLKIAVTEWRIYRSVKEDWLLGSCTLGVFAAFIGIQVQGLTEWNFGDQEIALLLWTGLGFALAVGRWMPGPTRPETAPAEGA